MEGIRIRRVEKDKWRYRALLLLADEQEDMIARYLERGTMYVLELCGEGRADGEGGEKADAAAAECVVTDEGNGVLELKSLAVRPGHQGKGYGRALIGFLEKEYGGSHEVLQAGTGESPRTVPFYEKCGFTYSHRIRDFFTKNYDHPIVEDGVLLKDMVYYRRRL